MTKQDQPSTPGESFVLKQPLQLYKTRRRRYVRLEIAAPIVFSTINVDRPLDHDHLDQQDGTLLNISGGGALLACSKQLAENSYISMNLELSGLEMLTGVVGKVKRVDDDSEGEYLVGVEFCSEKELTSVFGEANIGSVISSFDNRVKRYLLRYVFANKVSRRLRDSGQEDNNEE
jgi:c-di-GMP-binding flagellar brake protein YcgR